MNFIDVDEFLGARGEGIYTIRPETHGAFGGAFGGLVAAIAVRAARTVAPGREPVSLDVHFLRGVPAGDVRVDIESCTKVAASRASPSMCSPATASRRARP